MNLYLIVSRGHRADDAQPVLAISDQRLIRHFLVNVGTLLLPVGEERTDKVIDLSRSRVHLPEDDDE